MCSLEFTFGCEKNVSFEREKGLQVTTTTKILENTPKLNTITFHNPQGVS